MSLKSLTLFLSGIDREELIGRYESGEFEKLTLKGLKKTKAIEKSSEEENEIDFSEFEDREDDEREIFKEKFRFIRKKPEKFVCMHCIREREVIPVGEPVLLEKNEKGVFIISERGKYCTYNCMKTKIENTVSELRGTILGIFNFITREILYPGEKILPTREVFSLKCHGGNLQDSEFCSREFFFKASKKIKYKKYDNVIN